MTLDKKRILILGGITHMLDVVRKAHDMGLYTIVCDYSQNSPAKKIADKAYDISTTDIDALEKMAREEKVNAVFAGFEDLNTWNALRLCQRLKLPFYATEEQLSITSNKKLFKELCRKCGISVVEEYPVCCVDGIDSLSESLYPVIMKPVDSYGSKGITVCQNRQELRDAYMKALSFSKSKQIILEHFVPGYGVEMYYTVINGNACLSAMTDRYVIRQDGGVPPLPTATVFPSKHIVPYCKTMNENIKMMIHELGIINGVLLFQGVLEEGKVYVYEMAYRLTGEQHYHIIQKETGVDLLAMMIDLALGKDVSGYSVDKKDAECLPYPACNLAVLLKKGTIGKIEGLDTILEMPEIVSHVQTLFEGDTVDKIGNYGQICVRFNIVTKDRQRLLNVIDFINKTLQVFSPEGEDLVLAEFKERDIF